MPRADSLVLATGVRFKRCVLAPLESSMSCILGMICVACMLCVEITLVPVSYTHLTLPTKA